MCPLPPSSFASGFAFSKAWLRKQPIRSVITPLPNENEFANERPSRTRYADARSHEAEPSAER